jgi:Derlin-2/3
VNFKCLKQLSSTALPLITYSLITHLLITYSIKMIAKLLSALQSVRHYLSDTIHYISKEYAEFPPVSKAFISLTVFTCECVTFDLVAPESLIFDGSKIYYNYEIWRLVTPFFYFGKLSFPFMCWVGALCSFCPLCENHDFHNSGVGGTSAGYLVMVIFCMVVLTVLGYIFDETLYLPISFSSAMMYFSFKTAPPDAEIDFFIFEVKCAYAPWVTIAFLLLIGNPIVHYLLGYVCGHLFFYLVVVLPKTYGWNPLRTPQFCKTFMKCVIGSDSKLTRYHE